MASKLKFNKGNHTYRYDGKWIPSVTGIISKSDDKSGLLDWYAKNAAYRALGITEAEYEEGTEHYDLAQLSRMLRVKGVEATVEWLRTAANDSRDEAAFSGSDLHDLAERRMRGEEMPEHLMPETKLMVEQLLRFWERYNVRILHPEARLVNTQHWYSGTTDFLGYIEGYDGLVIGDYKTAKSGIYHTIAKQLAAYANANILVTQDDDEIEMPEVRTDIAFGVSIRPERHELVQVDISEAFDDFLAAKRLYYAYREGKDRLEKVPYPGGTITVDVIKKDVDRATSPDELIALYQDAVFWDLWNDDLKALFTQRKHEILSQ